jgi:serine/threonine-protein kinase
VHRDLKGANVVLGDFGEVIVLDWGLAKVQGRTTPAAETPPVVLAAETARQETVQGQVLGTPAYMAPEQAEGRQDLIEARTDVYGLGALLYEILTSQPPFCGADTLEVLRRVREEPPTPPRQVVPGVPPPLEAVCLKALAKRREDRYAAAADLAADVQRWLADEPVTVYREPRLVRLGRWTRRHRTLVVGAAAAALVAVVTLTAATGLLAAANRRERAERAKADANFRLAVQAVDKYYTNVSESPELKARGLEKLRTRLLETAAEFYENFVREEGGDRRLQVEQANAYRLLGRLYEDTGRSAQAEAAYRQAVGVLERLAAEPGADPQLQGYAEGNRYRLAWLYQNMGRWDEAEAELKRGIAFLEALAASQPAAHAYQNSLAWNYNDLGLLYDKTGRKAEAAAAGETALTLREHLAQEHPDNEAYQEGLAASHDNMAFVFRDRGQPARAEASLQTALRIRQGLQQKRPADAKRNTEVARSHYNLGHFYSRRRQFREAEAHFHNALEIDEKLAREHPLVPEFQRSLAMTCDALGNVYKDTNRFDPATVMHQKALAIWEKLASEYEAFPKYKVELGRVCCNLAVNLAAKGNSQKALDGFDRARGILEGVLERDPRNDQAQQYLHITRWSHAQALTKLGRHADAVAIWDRAIQLAAGDDRTVYRGRRAATLARAGDYARAVAEADEVSKTAKLPGNVCYGLGCAYALSAAAVRKDPGLDPVERQRSAEQYATRAVIVLRRAWDTAGWSPVVAFWKTDADLESLRERDDFKKLLADVEAKDKSAAK